MLRTLRHYWAVHTAVVLGAAVATAVLAGALLVGDSVRASLRALVLDRLGRIDLALATDRFFREELAEDLTSLEGVAPAIVLRGSATHATSGARASRVGIFGVDRRFAALFEGAALDLERREGQVFSSVVINDALRRELGVATGDAVVLHFARHSEVPRETLMGETDPDDVLGRMRLIVTAVIPDRGIGRFALAQQQQQPLNAYVSLSQLQRSLDRRGRVNALFSRKPPSVDAEAALARAITLDDLGLRLEARDGFVELASDEFVLRPGVDRVLEPIADATGARLLRIQSYLANRITAGQRLLPYSLIAALDPLEDEPWASLSPADATSAATAGENGILLNTWAAEDLDVSVGDEVDLHYFAVGSREELIERQSKFRVAGVVAMRGLGADRALTPEYPGIQEADDMTAWDPPFPVDLELIRKKDETYWDDFRATPKAFVSLATGRRLWSTRFGSTTSARFGVPAGSTATEVAARLREQLLERLAAETFGLRFREVKVEGLRASKGATDFSMLFISFSFFLIVSAALLVGLLFRLGVERRSGEIGLLLAVGYRVRTVRRRLLAEGLVLAAVGGTFGLLAGVGYASLMMVGLRTVWRPAVGTSELALYVSPVSLAIGWATGVAVVLVSVGLAVRRLVRVAPQRLLAGALTDRPRSGPRRMARALAWGGLFAGVGLLITAVVRGADSSVGFAFGTGSLLLVSGLGFFTSWCRAPRRRSPVHALAGMAARNSSWSPGRSVLSVALMASAAFVVVVIAVNRGEDRGLEARESGSGGFRLVAEADVPLHQDLNDDEARLELGFSDAASAELGATEVYAFRLRPGDDASCLNLYRPEQPRLLGVNEDFVRRGGFTFQSHLPLPDGVDDPWGLLDVPADDGAVPAIADANSAMWVLHTGLGQELIVDDESGAPLRLRLVGLLHRSVFRSELLIPERAFLERFPGYSGQAYFLFDLPPDRVESVAQSLERTLTPFGFDATTTRDKIAAYNAVENTYMATFQMLGAFGLLLGTVGLGVVLVRNVIERRGELATLRAFGFRRSLLAWLVLAENAFVLVVGIAVGTLAALAASAPRLVGEALPWSGLLVTLGAVWLVGMLSSVLAVRGSLRVPLLPALKAER